MNRLYWGGAGLVVAASILGGLVMFSWQQPSESQANADRFADPKGKAADEKEDKSRGDKFAENRAIETKAVDFDAKRAMEYLTELCKIGPRISGSEGMRRQQILLEKHFEKLGGKVAWQRFEGKQPSRDKAVPMANMIVTWNPDAKRRVIFCGHYDTRPIADQEKDEKNWTRPFQSANDGTSTVAFLMELAHHMKDLPRKVGVDFVIFDAEEFIYVPDKDPFFLGSNFFARSYLKEKNREYDYIAAVLLDLFAGKDATYGLEGNSRLYAGPLLEDVWNEAKRLGVKEFHWGSAGSIQDDHMALNDAKIPAIDIIDFSYKHWHKLSDLPENCSAESMGNVAKVLTSWIQRVR